MCIGYVTLIILFNFIKFCWSQTSGCSTGSNCANTCGAVNSPCPSGCARWYGGDSCTISVAPLDLSLLAPNLFQSESGPNAIITVSWDVFIDPRISASYFFIIERQLLVNDIPAGVWIAVDQVWKSSVNNTTHSAGVTGFIQNATYGVRVAPYRAVPGSEERGTVSQNRIFTTLCAKDLDGPAVMLTKILPNGTSNLDVTVEWVYPLYVYTGTVDHFEVGILYEAISAFAVPFPATGLVSTITITIPASTYYVTVAAVTVDGCVSRATPSLPVCSVPGSGSSATCVGPRALVSLNSTRYDVAFAVSCGVLIPLAVASVAWAIYTRLKICTCVGKMTYPLENKGTATADPVLTRSDIFSVHHSTSLASNLNVSLHQASSTAGNSSLDSEDDDQGGAETESVTDEHKLV